MLINVDHMKRALGWVCNDRPDGVSWSFNCCIFSESENLEASSVGVQTAWYVIGVFVGAWDAPLRHPETLQPDRISTEAADLNGTSMDLDLTPFISNSYPIHWSDSLIRFISDLPSNSIGSIGSMRWAIFAIFSMRSWWLRVLWVFGFAWRSFGWPCWPERSENAHGSSPVSLCRGKKRISLSPSRTSQS